MTVLYSAEMAGLAAVPVALPSGGVVDGNVRVKRATITLDTQTTSDTIVIAKAHEGESFLYGVLNASATLGASATVAIGVTGTVGKYRAAATHTAWRSTRRTTAPPPARRSPRRAHTSTT